MRASVRTAVFLAVVTGQAIGQEESTVALRAQAQRIVTGGIAGDERARCIDELLGSDAGAAALLLALRGEFDPAMRRVHKDIARHLDRFGKAAVECLRHRRGRTGRARIETLRREVLAHSRDAELAKDTIHTELDPRLAELATLFVVSVEDVDTDDADVGKEGRRVRSEVERLVELFLLGERVEAALMRSKNGATFLRAHALADDPRDLAEQIAQRERELAARATEVDPRDAKALERNRVATAGLDAEEVRGIDELNRIRMLLGIGALSIDVRLCEAARDHAADMVRLGFFSHESPVPGKRSFTDRAARAGTTASAENIAMGQATGVDAIRAWWYSPGHHRNMMSAASRVGLGRKDSHWTQMFGG